MPDKNHPTPPPTNIQPWCRDNAWPCLLLIGCDGLWDVMAYDEAINFVRARLTKGWSPQRVSEHLVKEALRRGSKDNITVLVCVVLFVDACVHVGSRVVRTRKRESVCVRLCLCVCLCVPVDLTTSLCLFHKHLQHVWLTACFLFVCASLLFLFSLAHCDPLVARLVPLEFWVAQGRSHCCARQTCPRNPQMCGRTTGRASIPLALAHTQIVAIRENPNIAPLDEDELSAPSESDSSISTSPAPTPVPIPAPTAAPTAPAPTPAPADAPAPAPADAPADAAAGGGH